MKFYKITIITLFLIGGMFLFNLCSKKTKDSKIAAELQEEVANYPLNVTGTIPDWLSGTLVRNGPIKVSLNGESNKHWFDGLAMLHAFSFQNGDVTYSNKFLRSDAYKTVFEKNSLNYEGFASDPCRSIFRKFLTFFIPHSEPSIQNANVNVAKLTDAYVALTEVPLPVKFDPKTLETLGVLNYKDQLPKEKCWESAHPHYDSTKKETINYLIKFGRSSYYTLYSLEDGSSERKIIAEIPVEEPAYMHSFAMTENHIIFTEFPLVVTPLDLIIKNRAFINNFRWQPERGARFIVVDKKNGNVIGQYTTKPFFAFHHANAFEKDGKIHIDLVTYNDAKIVIGATLYADLDKSIPPSQLERFSLCLKSGELTSEILFAKPNEFPRINEKFDGLPYHFVYLAESKDFTSGGLYKCNTETKEILKWSEKGCSAGEPIFVQAPGAKEEDDGVVLALIIDHLHKNSFLLILDAKSFKEIGRAKAPHLIPEGLHGQYFNI